MERIQSILGGKWNNNSELRTLKNRVVVFKLGAVLVKFRGSPSVTNWKENEGQIPSAEDTHKTIDGSRQPVGLKECHMITPFNGSYPHKTRRSGVDVGCARHFSSCREEKRLSWLNELHVYHQMILWF